MENNQASPNGKVSAESSPRAESPLTPPRSVDVIIAALALFTVEQRSLAWSPQPPFESAGAHDCRIGGSCGLDFNRETALQRWIQARHRWNRERQRLQDFSPAE
jgi:hypothetical protein